MSNNNTICSYLETTLHSWQIYSFSLDQHRLPCLTYIVNLTITAFMSLVTRIIHIKTSTAIWEFDLILTKNQVLSGSLNIIAALQTLVITIYNISKYQEIVSLEH